MFKSAVRKYSIKHLPVETQPANKYNAARSAFNLKPVPTQGLIYNPPAALPSLKDTPKVFLPPNDPRLKFMADKFKVYSQEELAEMPVIYGAKRDYTLTPEIIEQIIKLRSEDPDTWTIAKLAARFNVDAKKVNVVTGFSHQKQQRMLLELTKLKSEWSEKKALARQDRHRRKQQWLRGEF